MKANNFSSLVQIGFTNDQDFLWWKAVTDRVPSVFPYLKLKKLHGQDFRRQIYAQKPNFSLFGWTRVYAGLCTWGQNKVLAGVWRTYTGFNVSFDHLFAENFVTDTHRFTVLESFGYLIDWWWRWRKTSQAENESSCNWIWKLCGEKPASFLQVKLDKPARLNICSYFGWLYQILNLRRAGLSRWKS